MDAAGAAAETADVSNSQKSQSLKKKLQKIKAKITNKSESVDDAAGIVAGDCGRDSKLSHPVSSGETFLRKLNFRFELDSFEEDEEALDSQNWDIVSPEYSSPEEPGTKWQVVVYQTSAEKRLADWLIVNLQCNSLDVDSPCAQSGTFYLRGTVCVENDNEEAAGDALQHDSFTGVLRPGQTHGNALFLHRDSLPESMVLHGSVEWKPLPDLLLSQPNWVQKRSKQDNWSSVRVRTNWSLKDWGNSPQPRGAALRSSLFGRQGVVWGLQLYHRGHATEVPDTVTVILGLHHVPEVYKLSDDKEGLRHVHVTLKVAGQNLKQKVKELKEGSNVRWLLGQRNDLLKHDTLTIQATIFYETNIAAAAASALQ